MANAHRYILHPNIRLQYNPYHNMDHMAFVALVKPILDKENIK